MGLQNGWLLFVMAATSHAAVLQKNDEIPVIDDWEEEPYFFPDSTHDRNDIPVIEDWEEEPYFHPQIPHATNGLKRSAGNDGPPVIEDWEEDPYFLPAPTHGKRKQHEVAAAKRDVMANIRGDLQAVSDALENIFPDEFIGFRDNLFDFFEHYNSAVGSFEKKFFKAFLPMIEACPADTFQTFIVDFLKAFISLLEEMEVVFRDYNPLHPKAAEELRSLIRRKLTNISTLGSAIGKLFNKVDNLVVSTLEQLLRKWRSETYGIKELLDIAEQLPAEELKGIIVKLMKQRTSENYNPRPIFGI